MKQLKLHQEDQNTTSILKSMAAYKLLMDLNVLLIVFSCTVIALL